MNQMILEATQILDNMIAEYRKKEKNLCDLKEKEPNEEKKRIIIGLFLLVNETTENLRKIKKYLKNLEE